VAETEGVIRFELSFTPAPPPPNECLTELNSWRALLYRLGLTGRDRGRYAGLAYGNVSIRSEGKTFLVSGTQTGGKPWLTAADYCLVEDYDLAAHALRARGPIRPSSEALTHAAAYLAHPDIRCVLHVHSPELWRWRDTLGIPRTAPDIPYGTAAMAHAIQTLARSNPAQVVCMGGHVDGFIAFADSVENATVNLLRLITRMWSLERTQI